jgi:hypothetical protein
MGPTEMAMLGNDDGSHMTEHNIGAYVNAILENRFGGKRDATFCR